LSICPHLFRWLSDVGCPRSSITFGELVLDAFGNMPLPYPSDPLR
jgi:hypothetical protein